MLLNLAVPDGLQKNITPHNPNRITEQRTLQSVIVQDNQGIAVSNSAMLSSTVRFTTPKREIYQIQGCPQSGDGGRGRLRRRQSQKSTPIARWKQGTGSGDWRRGGAQGGGRKADEEAARLGGRGAGEDGAAGQDDPRTAGEGAAGSKRAGADEADNHGTGAAEGHIVDVGKGLTGATREGECSVGGYKGEDR